MQKRRIVKIEITEFQKETFALLKMRKGFFGTQEINPESKGNRGLSGSLREIARWGLEDFLNHI